MTDRNNYFMWACSEVREAVDRGMYGTITLSMQNGIIGNLKTETVAKPPVDNKEKRGSM